MDSFRPQLEVPGNATVRYEEIRWLQGCIRDLIRVQVALQGLGRLMENAAAITEYERAEPALQKLQSELAHVAPLTTMGEFAATIAHESTSHWGQSSITATCACGCLQTR